MHSVRSAASSSCNLLDTEGSQVPLRMRGISLPVSLACEGGQAADVGR